MSKKASTPDPTFTQGDVDRIVQERLARDRRERVTVVEPRTYSLDSPHSWYYDTIVAAGDPNGITYPNSHERLNRYAVEVAHEIEQRSPEGIRAERIIREQSRTSDRNVHERRHAERMREVRAVTTGGGATASASGGGAAAFVPPAFLISQYALFRASYRAFADQCHALPLPDYGMDVYLPYFASATSASQQVEGAGMSSASPTTNFQGSSVVTVAGKVTITQQLADRFALGGTADAVFARQLQQDLAAQVDSFALNQVITGGASVAGAASLTANSFKEIYGDLAKGREQLTDTAGVRLRPTHIFSTYDWYSFVTDIMGTDGRPMLMPTFAPGFPVSTAADDGLNGGADMPKWSRFTGTVMPGGVLWFTDDNIPASGTNTQVLVSAPDQAVVIMEGEPVVAVSPVGSAAASLGIVVSLREYVSVITRHASGTAIITGNAYALTSKS